MPLGIIGSLVICTILYCLGSLVLTGVVNYKQLHVPDPVAVATDAMGKPWLSFYVKIGAIAGLSSVILVMLMSQPRIFYAMSKDGLLPPIVAKIHPQFHTPYITTIITGLIVMMAAGLIPLSVAGELTSIGTLFAFAVVSGGVLYLRITQPDIERPFKAPMIWFTGAHGRDHRRVLLMVTLPADTWIRLIVWMVIGLVIYFLYGAHHSVLGGRKAAKAAADAAGGGNVTLATGLAPASSVTEGAGGLRRSPGSRPAAVPSSSALARWTGAETAAGARGAPGARSG